MLYMRFFHVAGRLCCRLHYCIIMSVRHIPYLLQPPVPLTQRQTGCKKFKWVAKSSNLV